MNALLYPILVPLIAGVIVLFIPGRVKRVKEALSFLVSVFTLTITIGLFKVKTLTFSMGGRYLLNMDPLASFIAVFVALFGLLTVVYSFKSMEGKDKLNQYYGYILMTIGGSIGAALANDLILFLTFWGFLGVTLYLLINLGGAKADSAAKKTLIIVGGSDALMILGVGIVGFLAKTYSIADMTLPLNSGLAIAAFLCLASGAFAKAGAMPLHTWIPGSSEVAPVSVMGFLPASLDKLLGIYFLARMSLNMFIVRPNSVISIILLAVGAVTIMAAVMMALVQHNMKKLLAYHAVSQVGYMVLGIGTGNPIGIAGGLFHMVNHAIYKCCLFLSSGAVEHKKQTTELDKLGGLSKAMPITYISCLIAALAISGVPPMNGFVSKWLVYQGVIELGKSGGNLWVIWLVAAIFGSALTLASFMKLIHATFLGQCPRSLEKKDEVSFFMWLPMTVLAFLCVLFGVFAHRIPLRLFIYPSMGGEVTYPGVWDSSLSSGLIAVGILVGLIIYAFGSIRKLRVDEPFIGGEKMTEDMRLSGVTFYKTIEDLPLLARIYKWAEKGIFDIYDQLSRAVFFFNGLLKRMHNGVLPTYLAWCLIGAIVLFAVFRQ